MKIVPVLILLLTAGIAVLLMRRAQEPAPPSAQAVARDSAETITRERLAALARGDFATWARRCGPEALLIAADPAEALVGPASMVAEMAKDFGPALGQGQRIDIAVDRLASGASRRGRIAWVCADLDYGVASGDERQRVPLRHSALLVRSGNAWTVELENDSQAPTEAELKEGAAAGRYPPPARLGDVVDRRANRIVRRFETLLEDPGKVRLAREACAIGPTRGELAAGDSAVRVMIVDWRRRFGAARIVDGGLRARRMGRGGSGWVAANLETRPPGWDAALPLRLTSGWRSRGEDSWELLYAHLSVGVPDPS